MTSEIMFRTADIRILAAWIASTFDSEVRMKIMSFLSVMLLAVPAFADSVPEDIEQAVVRGYVDGIWREASEEKVRSGFHPSFVMHALRDGEVTNVTLDAWLERLNLTGEGNPRIRHELEVLSHSGSAAATRVEIFEGERHLYTDYLGLYRFDDGWKIVSKIFYAHD